LQVVEHMERESKFFGAMFDEAELPQYLRTMARARTWGDELTLRAFADCFEVTVHVVASTEGNCACARAAPSLRTPRCTRIVAYYGRVLLRACVRGCEKA
jgi:hypothetical protein